MRYLVAASSALGCLLGLGLLPGQDRGAAYAQAPKPAAKVAAKKPAQFRYRFGMAVVESKAPGMLHIKGVFQVGDPAKYAQVSAQHLVVYPLRDNKITGAPLVNQEIGRINIEAGRGGIDFPFERVFKLPKGTYFVKIFSHIPGSTLTEDGVVGPDIRSWVTRKVDVL